MTLSEYDFRAALLYDGMNLLAKAVEKLTDEKDLDYPSVSKKLF